jgi:hypothetical protein
MPERPGQVTAAAVILIVLGVIVALFGILALLGAALFPAVADTPEFREQFGTMSDAFGTLFLTFGIIVLAYGILETASGIFVLSGRTWARITGLIVAVLGVLFSLLGVLPSQNSGATNVVSLVLLVAYGFVAWVLASRGAWFTR